MSRILEVEAEEMAVSSGIRVGGLSLPTWSRLRGSFFLQFTVIFALVALTVSLAAGFALGKFLGDEIRNETLEDVAIDVSESKANVMTSRLKIGRAHV